MPLYMQYDQIDSVTVNLGTYLSSRGIDMATDITEATFMVKNASTDDDTAAIVTKTIGAGIVLVPDATVPVVNDQFTVTFSAADWGTGALEPEGCYVYGIGLKTASDARFMEPELEDHIISISQDYIRE